MTKKRICDKCGKDISYPYYKIMKCTKGTAQSKYDESKTFPSYLNVHEADLCLDCWEDTLEGNNDRKR